MAIIQRFTLNGGWAEVRDGGYVLDGWWYPKRIAVFMPGAEGQPALNFVIAVEDGLPAVTWLNIEQNVEGRPVRVTDLRAIRLEEWVEDIVAAIIEPATMTEVDGRVQTVISITDSPNTRRAKSRVVRQALTKVRQDTRVASMDNGPLAQFVGHFRSANDGIRSLTEAVEESARRMGNKSPRTGWRYYKRAIDDGLLQASATPSIVGDAAHDEQAGPSTTSTSSTFGYPPMPVGDMRRKLGWDDAKEPLRSHDELAKTFGWDKPRGGTNE